MDKYNIDLIKKIRKKTGLSLLECKKVLIESNFDISLAIKKSLDINKDKLKKISLSKNIKGKIISGTSKDYKYSILLEINSETDFVSKNIKFNIFCNKIIKYSVENKIIDFDILNIKFNLYRLNLISKFNENISFGKKYIFYKKYFNYSYVHMEKIGVIVNTSNNFNLDIFKKISMQIISNKSDYISNNSINIDLKESKNILLEQKFIFNNNIYVKDILNEYNIEILDFKIIELLNN